MFRVNGFRSGDKDDDSDCTPIQSDGKRWHLGNKCSLYLYSRLEEVDYFSKNLFWRWLSVDFGEQKDLLEFLEKVQFLQRSMPYCLWSARYKRSIPLDTYLVVLFWY